MVGNVARNHGVFVTQIHDTLLHRAVVHHVALDGHGVTVPDENIDVRAERAVVRIVDAALKGISRYGDVLHPSHVDMTAFVFGAEFASVGASVAAEEISRDRSARHGVIIVSAQLQARAEGAIEEIARNG